MIEVKNLVKRYGNHTAVDHLNFTVEDGRVYGLLGLNGAGKSTTMNMVVGYLSATEGDIIVNGHNVFEEPEEAKKYIGYLPEIPPLYLDMTVKEYLVFAAELKKIPRAERVDMVEKAMDMTNIKEMESRLIKYLSKGYKQRVGLAQAILGFPKIIILDEPTVGLDPKQIIEIRDLIKTLKKNHTIILSSHIMQEISAVCDHIFIIDKGKLIAEGTPEQLADMTKVSQEISLRVKGSKDMVEQAVCGVKNVFKKEYLETQEEGTIEICVYAEKGKDIREALFYAMAEKRLPILAMNTVEKSLENVFLELTSIHPASEDELGEEKNFQKDESETVSDQVPEESEEA